MDYKAFVFRNRWFLVCVMVPTLIAAFYYGLIASGVYVSESRFVVKNQSDRPNQLSTIASLIQTTGLSSGQEQTQEVLDYIRSRSALADLQRHVDVRGAYAHRGGDFYARYPGLFQQDTFENLYRYYSHAIDAKLDTQSSLAVLDVEAFNAEDAQRINAKLLDLSEELVNRLNEKAHSNAISEAEKRVTLAQKRARAARLALAQYRNSENIIDPTRQATGVLDISNKLVAEQAALQAQVDLMEKVTPENPAIPSLKARIAAIGRSADAQNARVVGSNGAISSKIANYENLQLEQEFSAQALTAASAALEEARVDAARQQFYLERVVDPNRADMALLPHGLRNVLTVFAVATCLYLIGWMLIVGILEHSPEG